MHADSGPDVLDAGAGNDVVYVNNGSGRAQRGLRARARTRSTSTRTASPGGISNARALREDRIRGCEHVDRGGRRSATPPKGVLRMARSARGSDAARHGAQRHPARRAGRRPACSAAAATTCCGATASPAGRSTGSDFISGGAGKRHDLRRARWSTGSSAVTANDMLQGGPGGQHDRGRGRATITVRLTGHGRATVRGGRGQRRRQRVQPRAGDDRLRPGGRRVNIGFNRSVPTINCETVTHRHYGVGSGDPAVALAREVDGRRGGQRRAASTGAGSAATARTPCSTSTRASGSR